LLAESSARNVRNSLVKDNPTVAQFVDMLERYDVFNKAKNVDEELLRSIAMYGARQRQNWLLEGDSKYPDFLGTSALALKMKQWRR
jgi:hypothetical protein